MSMTSRLSIKARLLILGFFSIGSTLLILTVLSYLLGQIEYLKDGQALLQRAEFQVLKLRQLEKDFASERQMAQVDSFNSERDLLASQLEQLSVYSAPIGLGQPLSAIQQQLQRYDDRFQATVQQYQDIGLTQNEGLRGSLRAAVHGAESAVRELEQDHLLASILMLRRHEKDFLLRHQLKYLQKFQKQLTALNEQIDGSPVVALQSEQISSALKLYGERFEALVSSWQTLGLKGGTGLRGEMSQVAEVLEQGAALLMQQFSERLKQQIAQIHQSILIVAVATTLMLLLMLALIGNSILKPLREVTGLVRNLASREGDLTMRLDFKRQDELGELANGIDLFIAKTHRIVTQIAERVSVVSDSAQQGAAIAEQTNQGVNRQRGEIEQISGSIHEMAGTAASVAERAGSAAELADEACSTVKQSENSMQASVDGIQQLTEEVNRAAEVLSQLAEDSRNITSIVAVIRDVSEQTNLLALNAAIEAARAGDQGRGFAVVADEVRSLAVKTHDSTEQINEFIRQLQERSEHAVSVMQRGTNQSRHCIEQADQASEQLERVVQAIQSINGMTSEILNAASGQQQVAGELDANMGNMRDVALEVAEGARQTNDDSLHLNELAAQLSHQVQKFRF